MASVLISGPAGAAKSAKARELLREASGLTVAADFHSIYAALTLAVRDPETGLYPPRDNRLLPLVEFLRRVILRQGIVRDFDVIATNSDGDPDRRVFLLGELGPGAAEIVIDPGEETVKSRLRDPVTGELSAECEGAIRRWYRRK